MSSELRGPVVGHAGHPWPAGAFGKHDAKLVGGEPGQALGLERGDTGERRTPLARQQGQPSALRRGQRTVVQHDHSVVWPLPALGSYLGSNARDAEQLSGLSGAQHPGLGGDDVGGQQLGGDHARKVVRTPAGRGSAGALLWTADDARPGLGMK